MLAQDEFGRVYDVPATAPQMVFDGLGNPIGFGPLLNLVTAPVRGLVNAFRPSSPAQAAAHVPVQVAPPPVPGASPFPFPLPGFPGFPGGLPGFPGLSPTGFPLPGAGFRFPLRRAPHPVGWITPALPYTGVAPRRLYMRCATWAGPAGLVPGPQMAPTAFPGVAPPGMSPMGPSGYARRRRRRRR